jgi:hypothetical protein
MMSSTQMNMEEYEQEQIDLVEYRCVFDLILDLLFLILVFW